MNSRSLMFLVVAACAALGGCKNDDVKTESLAAPATPAPSAPKADAPTDCSSHESKIVQLSGQLAASETAAADLKVRIEQLRQKQPVIVATAPPAKTKACAVCPEPEQVVYPTVAAEPGDDRTAAECAALDRKFEARYQFLSKTVAELEVENYLNEHAITELEKTVGKAKK